MPGGGPPVDADAQLAKVGKSQAQSSYYYRHGGNTNLFDPGGKAPAEPNIRLSNLGMNSNGVPIRALVMDTVFLASQDFSDFGIKTLTNHKSHWVNVLYADGHVNGLINTNGRFTINDQSYGALDQTFGSILKAFETADAVP